MLTSSTAERILHMDWSIQPGRSAPAGNSQSPSGQAHLDRTSVRRLRSKEQVFCEGDLRTNVFQIEDGVVTIYQMLNDGRRQIIDFAYPGDFVGLGTTPEHLFGAEATCEARLRCYGAAALEETARNDPSLALQLYKAVSLELLAARALLVAIGQRSAIERVAAFLLMLQRRTAAGNGRACDLHLPMRRADIGDFLGLTIETVSRTITKLRAMHIIEVSHGTDIRINDLERLAELSEGQFAY